MPDTVNVPVLGKTPKGGVLAGGLAVVGVAGYLIYKHYTTPKGVPAPGGGAYGYGGYGAASFGYGSLGAYGYGSGYSPYGTGGFGGGGQYYPWGPGTAGYGYGSGGQPITTNAQWGQAAEAALGSTGRDSTAAAIAKYLFGAPMTPDQALIAQEAEAVTGPPPIAGILGYPPKMHIIGHHPGQNGHKKPPARTTTITVHRTQTLSELARSRGWSSHFLSEVEAMTHLSAGSTVHRGEKLKIPAGSTH